MYDVCMYVCVCVYVYAYKHLSLYIYIYIHTLFIHTLVLSLYIHVYIYIEREKEILTIHPFNMMLCNLNLIKANQPKLGELVSLFLSAGSAVIPFFAEQWPTG